MKLSLTDPLVKDFVVTQAGESAYKVMRSLGRGKTDEQISKKTKLKVNDIRAELNKLHYMGIIFYSKVKAEKSNWYTYTWFIKKDRISELLKERYSEEMEKLNEKLSFEKNYTFFKCENGCEKLPFEIAFEYDFKCPECGHSMDSINSKSETRKIKRKINQIGRLFK